MSAPDYDPEDNSRRCYDLAIKAAREACIRRGQIAPDPSRPEEVRWAQQGPVSPDRLATVAGYIPT